MDVLIYSFLRFEAENVLKMFFNLHDMQFFKKIKAERSIMSALIKLQTVRCHLITLKAW